MDLGPFELITRTGAGGMGEVWRGRHRRTQLPVAVKLVTRALDDAARARFAAEVRAVAMLDHPHVVPVLARGTARAVAGLPDGCPWLAMPWAEGTLADRPVDASELRDVVDQVLAGLAHAHAHGVLHRDLKPANVLWLEGRWVLADFGIARVGGHTTSPRAGTRGFAAPEQLTGASRDEGPWTDLFALGATLRQLAGRALVSDAAAAWVDRLCATHPADRYPSAAAARAALPPDLMGGMDTGWEAPSTSAPTVDETQIMASGDAGAGRSWQLPPLSAPDDWRARVDVPRVSLPDAGTSLLELREPPLVGREGEQDALWQALLEAQRRAAPRAVRLVGAAGSGRARLARWLGWRAYELAGIRSVEVVDADCASALARFTRTSDLSIDATADHLRAQLPPHHLLATDRLLRARVAAVLHGEAAAPREQRGLLVQLVAGLAQQGLLILSFIGASRPALPLMRELVERADVGGLLVVLAGEVGEVDEARYPVQTVVVGELAPPQMDQLCRALHLDDAAAGHVANLAGGRPGYARHLVHAWTADGTLVTGSRGLVLTRPPGEPPDLTASWRARLDSVLVGASQPAIDSLVVAALLDELSGPLVDAARGAVGLAVPDDLLDALTAAGLVRHDARPRFAHPAIRHALTHRARDRADLHLACAEALLGTPRVAQRGEHLLAAGHTAEGYRQLILASRRMMNAARYGEVLRLLERFEDAPASHRLHAGILRAMAVRVTGDLTAAQAELDRIAAEVLELGDRRLVAWHRDEQARIHDYSGELERAWAAQATNVEGGGGDTGVVVPAVCHLVDLGCRLGYAEALRGPVARARAFLEQPLDPVDASALQRMLARYEAWRGRPDLAEPLTRRALAGARQLRLVATAALCLADLADMARARGDLSKATAHYREAARLTGACHHALAPVLEVNVALCLTLAERWHEARAALHACAFDRQIPSWSSLAAAWEVTASEVALGLGDHAEAEARLEAAASRLDPRVLAGDPDFALALGRIAQRAEDRGLAGLAARARALAGTPP